MISSYVVNAEFFSATSFRVHRTLHYTTVFCMALALLFSWVKFALWGIVVTGI